MKSMDMLSEILRSHASGASLLCRLAYHGKWAVEIPEQAAAGLHYIESGVCFLRVKGQTPRRLLQGDVVVIPSGSAHILSDSASRRLVKIDDCRAQVSNSVDGPVAAKIVCAAQRFDIDVRSMHPLMRELPAYIHIDNGAVQSCPSLGPSLRLLMQELQHDAPARSAIVELLIELFLVYVIRHWVQEQKQAQGWVAAVRDTRFSRVLSAIHGTPQQVWTVRDLARVAGMSRPAFAKKFSSLIGEPPLAYVTHVRMAKAAKLLQDGDETLSAIAGQVGYTSEFAFSRAFKRAMGGAPGKFRRQGNRALPHLRT